MKNTRLLLGLVLLLRVGILRADEAEDRNKVEDKRVEISQAQTEERAEKALEKLGGRLYRDDKAPGKPVVSVDLSGTILMDEDLKGLAALPQLHTLNLAGTKVTDAGLKNLATLNHLKDLVLGNTSVTEAGVQQLQKALPGLVLWEVKSEKVFYEVRWP